MSFTSANGAQICQFLLPIVNCSNMLLGRPFVKRFVLCYWTIVCLSVLSVTLVYCDQTVGWINRPLGMEVGLRPGHIVLDGDLAPPKGHNSPQFSTHVYCGQNGWMDQDAVGYGGRPRPTPHCVRWGPCSSPDRKGHSSPQLFSACLSLLCSGRGFDAVVNYIGPYNLTIMCLLHGRRQACPL